MNIQKLFDAHNEGKLIGITFSCFDMLHAGHVAMLHEAKSKCDYLLVGLQTDPTLDRPDTKTKPIQTIVERQLQLAAVSCVDDIIIYERERDIIDIMEMFPIGIRIIGDEYKDKEFTSKQYCLENGVFIYYNSRKHRFSSTDLKSRVRK